MAELDLDALEELMKVIYHSYTLSKKKKLKLHRKKVKSPMRVLMVKRGGLADLNLEKTRSRINTIEKIAGKKIESTGSAVDRPEDVARKALNPKRGDMKSLKKKNNQKLIL